MYQTPPRPDHFDGETAQNALCLYEAMLDGRNTCPALADRWETFGSYDMRDAALILAFPADELWHAIDNAGAGNQCDGIAWDFEFLPELVTVIDWAGLTIPDAARDHMRAWVERQQASNAEAARWSQWRFKACNAGGRIWGFLDLVDEDPDAAKRAYADGADPVEYIRELGASLDLTEPDPYTARELARRHPA